MKKIILSVALIAVVVVGGLLLRNSAEKVSALTPEQEAHYEEMMIAGSVEISGSLIKKYTTFYNTSSSTDPQNIKVKTGWAIEQTYKGFPLVSWISKDGFQGCRRGVHGTSTKSWCIKRTKFQMNKQIELDEEMIDQKVVEAGLEDFSDEITNNGL